MTIDASVAHQPPRSMPPMPGPMAAGSELARSTLGDEVYRVLWHRILDGRLRAGEKLSDLRLSDELGVSRTPVREALLRLVKDGIARAEPNRGFYVASFSVEDVAEIYELRAVLECMALNLAAPRLTEDELQGDLAEMDRLERRIEAANSEEERLAAAFDFLQSDRAFHRRLVERAERKRLAALVQGLSAQIAVFQEAGSFLPSLVRQSIIDHRAIIHALLANDPAGATTLLRRHILYVKGRVVADVASSLDDHARANPLVGAERDESPANADEGPHS